PPPSPTLFPYTTLFRSLPSPDETYILVANQNGKLVHRITTDYLHNAFTLDTNATLNLATGTTPSGALKQDDGAAQVNVRPDNARSEEHTSELQSLRHLV